MGEAYNKIPKRIIDSKCIGVVCEKCGSKEITEISYGLPAWITIDEPIDPRIEKLLEEKRIVLEDAFGAKSLLDIIVVHAQIDLVILEGLTYKNMFMRL